ncbi:MAG: hypothetical protein HYT75_00890 [Deltaproteobacteria bacterium]|nr:hypothetical protein [Deltaproteobacteria bacterium]
MANPIGVRKIVIHDEKGASRTYEVPVELSTDPAISFLDTAKPIGVLDESDAPKDILWHLVGYVGNRMFAIEQNREMVRKIDELNAELEPLMNRVAMVHLLAKKVDTNDKSNRGLFVDYDDSDHLSGHVLYHVSDQNIDRFIKLAGADGKLIETEVPVYDQSNGNALSYTWSYKTGSQLEKDLNLMKVKMAAFFSQYGWDGSLERITPPSDKVDIATLPQLRRLRDLWNPIATYINEEPYYGIYGKPSVGILVMQFDSPAPIVDLDGGAVHKRTESDFSLLN